ncbi:hypothetical protein [Pseudoalteromonas piscicida]|uniref:hypothetical protein n=1 Tax=Pseudoalteromonas piscicida TaxID=43662 RepID=UPI000E35D3F3|nr:hypothetical protein [Pseudoalteromonas piscicida]AXQ99462.1 hypothetical protein D0N37_18230 [Pseudoalteromonas piscicida]
MNNENGVFIDKIKSLIKSKFGAFINEDRPEIFKEFLKDYEYETKFQVHNIESALKVFNILQGFNIQCLEIRSEEHHLYSDMADQSVCKIFLKPDDYPKWIKLKSSRSTLFTDNLKIPLIKRRGVKTSLSRLKDTDLLSKLTNLTFISTFKKETINLFFTYKDAIFSLSFSLAHNDRGFTHNQAELEYEGECSSRNARNEEGILSLYDDLIANHFYSFEFNAEAKADVLNKYEAFREIPR